MAIYVAIQYGGEYDEAYEKVLAASTDKEKVEAFIEERKQTDLRRAEIYRQKQQFLEQYQDNHEEQLQDTEPIKKWPAGLRQSDITPDMRAERDEALARNEAIRAKNHSIMDAAKRARELALANFLGEIGVPEQERQRFVDMPWLESRSYRIEAVREL